jgi:hypothetical protein
MKVKNSSPQPENRITSKSPAKAHEKMTMGQAAKSLQSGQPTAVKSLTGRITQPRMTAQVLLIAALFKSHTPASLQTSSKKKG